MTKKQKKPRGIGWIELFVQSKVRRAERRIDIKTLSIQRSQYNIICYIN